MPDTALPTDPATSGTGASGAPPAAYAELHKLFGRLGRLGDASGILGWDAAALMQPGSGDARSDVLAELAVLSHEMLTEPKVGQLLNAAEADAAKLNTWDAANLALMRRQHTHATALDSDLVGKLKQSETRCEFLWREARKQSDFKMLQPALQEMLYLKQQAGQAKAAAFGSNVYDSLLDEFEPGGSAARIDVLFDDLAKWLPTAIEGALDAQARRPAVLPFQGPFPVPRQEEAGRLVMAMLGFDFSRGRLDVSAHPFCGGATDDVRITTRYNEDDFRSALMGVAHETGHAIYEQQRPQAFRHQPVGNARGMALHESQSLLHEFQACRSREVMSHLAPRLAAVMGGSGPAWAPENMYRHYTHVERGLIRVEADEVTYPAHVILRYRLEKAMLEGQLPLGDLPGAWSEGLQKLLGRTPPNDALGCLQDIHWPSGGWGYFPTYTMGALAAAQLFQAAKQQVPNLMDHLGKGDFAPLRQWLAVNVHGEGSRLSTDELLTKVTGRPLGTDAFKAHIQARYIDDVGGPAAAPKRAKPAAAAPN